MTYVASESRYDGASFRRTGNSGLLLPAVSLGLWQNFGDVTPFETQREIVTRAFDLGVTHFDLANNYGPPYGSAESNFGRIVSTDLRQHRDEMVISTKAGYDMWPGPYGDRGSRKYLLASLDQSLNRMGVDYVDIFYSHRADPDTPLAQGLLTSRYLTGVPSGSRNGSMSPSMIAPEVLDRVRALNGIAERRGQTLAQMALSWCLRDARVTSVLVGASSVSQLEDNLAATKNLTFDEAELAEIDKYAEDLGLNLWESSSAVV
ncbi:MAG: aldo/keto reductase [Actinomycetales bacterium]|nr:aldo/keto reductase [Actinomycetales bacterium]